MSLVSLGPDGPPGAMGLLSRGPVGPRGHRGTHGVPGTPAVPGPPWGPRGSRVPLGLLEAPAGRWGPTGSLGVWAPGFPGDWGPLAPLKLLGSLGDEKDLILQILEANRRILEALRRILESNRRILLKTVQFISLNSFLNLQVSFGIGIGSCGPIRGAQTETKTKGCSDQGLTNSLNCNGFLAIEL